MGYLKFPSIIIVYWLYGSIATPPRTNGLAYLSSPSATNNFLIIFSPGPPKTETIKKVNTGKSGVVVIINNKPRPAPIVINNNNNNNNNQGPKL